MARKPRTTTAIRFDPEVHEALAETAADLGVSMNWLVNHFVEHGLQRMGPVTMLDVLLEAPRPGSSALEEGRG